MIHCATQRIMLRAHSCTQNTKSRHRNRASFKLSRFSASMVLFVVSCLASDSVPKLPALQVGHSAAIQIDGSPTCATAAAASITDESSFLENLEHIDPRTIIVADALAKHEDKNGEKFINRLRNSESLQEIEVKLQEKLAATKRALESETYITVDGEVITPEQRNHALSELDMISGDFNENIVKLKESISKLPGDCGEPAKSSCCTKFKLCVKSTIEQGLVTELTAFLSSVILGIAACNVIVHKYYAPAGLWTISEGLSRIPREFTVPGFIITSVTGMIGGWFELYKGMLPKLGVDSEDEVRCCGLCNVTNKRIKQIQLVSMGIGVLSMVPTAYFRTGYTGEKSIHTWSSVGVFQSITATAACLHILFSNSKMEKIKNYAAVTGILIETSVALLGIMAMKKFGRFKGGTMSLEDCERIYSSGVCSQRNAKTYTGMPQALQLGFSIAEHASLGFHITMYFALNALLHPKNRSMSSCIGFCVDKIVDKLPKCCSWGCGVNSCVKPKRDLLRELEEGTEAPTLTLSRRDALSAPMAEPEEKENKCCSRFGWPEWCGWSTTSPGTSPPQGSPRSSSSSSVSSETRSSASNTTTCSCSSSSTRQTVRERAIELEPMKRSESYTQYETL